MESKKAPAQRRRVERGIYRQPNGTYAVCFMLAGKPRFRTVAGALDVARRQRELLVAAAEAGALAVSPRVRFATMANRWLERCEARVAAGERRERTLEAHRYHVSKHLLPTLELAADADDRRRGCRRTGHRPQGEGLLGEDGCGSARDPAQHRALRDAQRLDRRQPGRQARGRRAPSTPPGGTSGCLGARRSGACWALACRDTGRCSPPRSTRGCGSPSCWDRSGMTSTSPPA